MKPVLMTKEYWADSMLSIARYYGRINFEGSLYIVVDKLGRDLFECSMIAEKEGRDKAIEPGDPADLIRDDFLPLYKKLGRDKFIEIIKAHPEIEKPKQMKEILK